jgi:hypothetical protein
MDQLEAFLSFLGENGRKWQKMGEVKREREERRLDLRNRQKSA